VVVVWILFPIMVWIKFNELLEAQRAIHRALLAANTVREEIAKALQWMVDNWMTASRWRCSNTASGPLCVSVRLGVDFVIT
jgi:ammonia channel protein AmtB